VIIQPTPPVPTYKSEPHLLRFWSLIYILDEEVAVVFAHVRRVLRPVSPLLLGFHLGDQARLKTEGYGGHPMSVRIHRRPLFRVVAWLRQAGFIVEAASLNRIWF
jgi:hypothetical protein